MAQLMAEAGAINCGVGFTRVHCRYFARLARSFSVAFGDEWPDAAQPSIANGRMSNKAPRIVVFITTIHSNKGVSVDQIVTRPHSAITLFCIKLANPRQSRGSSFLSVQVKATHKMVRIAFSISALLLCAFLLPERAHAQEIAPRSYLFLEVADAAGQTVSEATVRVANANGKEIFNAKTGKNGTVNTSFNRGHGSRHYDLLISKSGYLPYESVLFPDVVYERFNINLSEGMPNTLSTSPTGQSGYGNRPALKITLLKPPATPAELRLWEAENRKHQLLLAVKRSDAPGLRKLLQQGVDAHTADAKGVPAVAWATFAGDPEVIKLLLEAGASVRDKASAALLIYLAEGGQRNRLQAEIVDKLIAAGADVNASNSFHGTVLNKAIIQVPHALPAETINTLIKAGADVNAPDVTGQTPLMLAISKYRKDLFDMLIGAGAMRSLHAKDKEGSTALLFAATGYKDATLPIVKELLANGARVSDVNAAGATPLMLAARATANETIQLLLKSGASINAKDKQGQTALMFAVKHYFSPAPPVTQTVKLLLAAGAAINDVDANGHSALMYAVEGSMDLELINLLITTGANVNLVDKEGKTALLIAAQRYSSEMVQVLLKAGAAATINAKDIKERTALLHAVEYGREEIVNALIAAGARVDEVNERGETSLILAVQRNNAPFAKLLLAAGASVNLADKSGNTALMYAKAAASGPEAEIFKALIAAGASLNHVNEEGQTPLIVAASKRDNLATVQALLATSARTTINARAKNGETALMYAAAYSDPEIVSALLAAGAKVNDVDNFGQTALMSAVRRYERGLEVVRILLQAGASVTAADAKGQTALLHLPFLPGDSPGAVFKELIAAGANVNAADAAGQTVLISIVQRRFPELTRLALEAGATVNAKDRNGKNALFYALSDYSGIVVEIVRALIAAGANVNDADPNGHTPLMLAAHKQSMDAVRMLLAAGAEINAKDKGGQTALLLAAMGHDYKDTTEVVRALLAAKANVEDADQLGRTALMFAAQTSYVRTVEALLKAGASVKVKDRDGKTALIHAADEFRSLTTSVVQVLLAAGANVNEVDRRQQTPLMLAALRGSLETVNILLAAGAAVNARDEDRMTPLMFAAWGYRDSTPDVVKALFKAGARVNDVDKNGKSVLMFAAQYSAVDLVRLLLGARASVNAKNKDGETALVFAIKGYSPDDRQLEKIQMLIRSGADVNTKTRAGETPLDLARKLAKPEIVKLIEESQSRQ